LFLRWKLRGGQPRSVPATALLRHPTPARRADPAQIQALLVGHASLETAGRYFRAGTAETAAIVERIFD